MKSTKQREEAKGKSENAELPISKETMVKTGKATGG
jgi:hypothetical protein